MKTAKWPTPDPDGHYRSYWIPNAGDYLGQVDPPLEVQGDPGFDLIVEVQAGYVVRTTPVVDGVGVIDQASRIMFITPSTYAGLFQGMGLSLIRLSPP